MYLKNSDKVIPDGLTQIWYRDINFLGMPSASKSLNLKQEHVITSLDLEIVKFIYLSDITTKELIAKNVNIEDADAIDKNLKKLLNFNLINYFALGDETETKIKDDAKLFYVVDNAAIGLLEAYTDFDDIINYNLSNLVMTSTKVNKRLMRTEFYFKLKETLGDRLKWWKKNPLFSCSDKKYRPDAAFAIEGSSGKKVYFLEVSRLEDYYEEGTTRLVNKLSRCETIVSTNAWRKYSDASNPPSLLFLCDNDAATLKCADIATTAGLVEGFRLTNIDNIRTKELKNCFVKFEDGTLKNVVLKNFKKDI